MPDHLSPIQFEHEPIEELLPGLASLWKQTTGSPFVTVAVIDSALDYDHECFAGADLRSTENGEYNPTSGLAHGTEVSSILFAQHTSPIKGISPMCKGIGITIYENGQGKLRPASQVDLARAINIAIENKADIINISGGQLSVSASSETLLANAVKKCSEKGILIVAAAGNDGCQCLHLPAAEPLVMAVGSMNKDNHPSPFSNWGDAYKRNGLLFPGNNIPVAQPDGRYGIKSGTSYASAIAAGVVALLLSLARQQHRKYAAKDIFNLLLNSATHCDSEVQDHCERTLAGTVNLSKAIEELMVSMLKSTSLKSVPAIVRESTAKRNKTNNLNQNQIIMSETNEDPNLMPIEGSHEENDQSVISPQEASLNEISQILTQETIMEDQPLSEEKAKVLPSDCSCKNKTSAKPSLVYAIGTLGYEFISEAKKKSFQQAMGEDPNNPELLLKYLDENPESIEDVLWTLNLDTTQVYVIYPMGGYSPIVYDRLKNFLKEQLAGRVHRVSVPGTIGGRITLMNGLNVSVLVPKGQGMYSWSTEALVEAVVGIKPSVEDAAAFEIHESKSRGIHNFLDRVYYELRNLGITAEERAINYVATNAFQLENVFEKAVGEQMELSSIDIERSPICPPNSDCWDVKLIFFNPDRINQQARKVYRFTVDVSHVIPVTVGEIRFWNMF